MRPSWCDCADLRQIENCALACVCCVYLMNEMSLRDLRDSIATRTNANQMFHFVIPGEGLR